MKYRCSNLCLSLCRTTDAAFLNFYSSFYFLGGRVGGGVFSGRQGLRDTFELTERDELCFQQIRAHGIIHQITIRDGEEIDGYWWEILCFVGMSPMSPKPNNCCIKTRNLINHAGLQTLLSEQISPMKTDKLQFGHNSWSLWHCQREQLSV